MGLSKGDGGGKDILDPEPALELDPENKEDPPVFAL